MPGRMSQPYEGGRPYIFACYAHADRDAVLPIVRALADEGFRVWWDDGIEPTADYDEYLADHVHGCDCLVMFVSTSSLRSDWCTLEVRYALDLRKRGADSWWWLRSPYASDSNVFLSVNSDGDWDAYCADVDGGVSPGFCL